MGRILKLSFTNLGRIENLWQVWYNGKQRKRWRCSSTGTRRLIYRPSSLSGRRNHSGRWENRLGKEVSIHVSRRNTVRACYPQ